jgi:hypothetical protein
MTAKIQLQYEKKIKELEGRVADLELQLKVSLDNQLRVLKQYRLDYPGIDDDQLLDYIVKDGN